jgi:hypothetical protein
MEVPEAREREEESEFDCDFVIGVLLLRAKVKRLSLGRPRCDLYSFSFYYSSLSRPTNVWHNSNT